MRRYKRCPIPTPPALSPRALSPEATPEDAPLRLADFLPYRISVTAESVSHAFAARYEAEFGLSIPEWRIMAVLGEGGPLLTRAVIARTAMDRVKVSRAVIRLADKGLIVRAAHPKDQRTQMLRLAPGGLALYRRIIPLARALQAELAEALTAAELRVLDGILGKLQHRAARLLGGEDPA